MTRPIFNSKLLNGEDYWAIWLGGFFLIIGIIIYLVIAKNELEGQIVSIQNEQENLTSKSALKSIDWYILEEKKQKLTGSNTRLGKQVKYILSKPKTWDINPLNAFYGNEYAPSEENQNIISILENELILLEENVRSLEKFEGQNDLIDQSITNAIDQWLLKKEVLTKLEKKVSSKGYNIFSGLLMLGIVLGVIFGIGAYFMGNKYFSYVIAFLGLFVLGVMSYFLAAQADMKNLGISYAVWAILIGLIISNSIGTPHWLMLAAKTEYYIKTGLVLLGAEILLSKIVAIGLPGIFVAWVVTPIVLITTFWFGQRILKIGSKTLNITISADMSVCGVSAAIATAAACNAKKEELTLAVGLSMVFTSIMMIALPAFINAVGIPEVLGGAWIGGTIDATGAVVAAGAFLGDKALNVAATIKMIQNVLIGIIAFGVALYWATKVENKGKAKIGISEIWKRFPKFILGFLGASILFSLIYALSTDWFSEAFIDQGIIRGFTKDLRGWLFCLAFVSIGLLVNFKELKHQFSGGKPLILYVCGQALNLLLTLIMAYVMFYLVFPEITEMI